MKRIFTKLYEEMIFRLNQRDMEVSRGDLAALLEILKEESELTFDGNFYIEITMIGLGETIKFTSVREEDIRAITSNFCRLAGFVKLSVERTN